MLLLCATASTLAVSHMILDASNLQLGLRPGLSTLALSSLDVPRLHERMDMMARVLTATDKVVSTTALFDGGAFSGEHAGNSWECDPEAPDAAPVAVRFTEVRVSADDAVVAFAQDVGDTASAPRAEIVTSGHARSVLEQPLPVPRPVFAATLLKSAMGKGKRDKYAITNRTAGLAMCRRYLPLLQELLLSRPTSRRVLNRREAFLRTCGLTKMGDTVHLPCFDETQQERALNLIRGLHSLERGVVRIEMLTQPAALVVSDDRGLRRRCFQLGCPPVVLGRKQWENWLMRLELPPL